MKRVPIRIVLSLVLLICSIMLCLGSSSFAETCIQPPSGMIGWWTGDGNANDIVSLNNGMLQGGATFAAGKVGDAFKLEGIDDAIRIPETETDMDGFSQLTIDAWIYPITVSGGQAIVTKYDTTINGASYFFNIDNGALRFGIIENIWSVEPGPANCISAIQDIRLVVVESGPGVIPVNTWTHVTGVWSGGTNLKLYKNGVEIAGTVNKVGNFQSMSNNQTPVNIGRIEKVSCTNHGLPSSFFNGLIDEVEIFNRALTAEEIKSIYNAGSAGKCKQSSCVQPPSDMIGWWPGDGNANDIVGLNNGMLQGGATFVAGKVGDAFQLDGVDDYVAVPRTWGGTSEATIDAWFKTNATTGDFQAIVSSNASGEFVHLQLASYGNIVAYTDRGVVFMPIVLQTPTDVYRHIAFSIKSGDSRLYVDGELVGTNTLTFSTILPTSNLRIGSGHLNGRFFKGNIDEVEIFNRALTAEEIKSIYNAGSAGKCKPSLVNVRLVDTIPTQDVEFVLSSATKTPYSVTQLTDKTIVEWRYPSFGIGQSETISFDLDLYRLVSGENRLIDHKLEVIYTDLNGKEVRYELPPLYVDVLSSAFVGVISTDKPVYGANEDVNISSTIKSLSEYTRTLDAKVLIEDAQGVLVKEITTISGLNFAAGEEKNLGNLIFNTNGTFTGSYRAHLFLYDQQKLVGEATANFTIQTALTITNKVTTDKISYPANQPVTITSTITSLSPNYIFQNLTARVSVLNNSGQVLFTEDKPIQTLVPGQFVELKTYWNTAANQKGQYTVVLEVIEGLTVLSTSQATFEILGSSNTGSGLVGTITAAPNPIYQGNTETITYNITNKGNEAITALNTRIIIVDPDTREVKIEFASQGLINIAETIAGIQTTSTAVLPPKIYLAILQAYTPEMPSPLTLASATFEVKPALEAEKKIPDITNLLVWINDGCKNNVKDDKCGCESKDKNDDRDDDEECECEQDGSDKDNHNDCDDSKCSHHKKCIRQDLLENILKETVTSYLIVKDKKDLEKELRNPYYTDIMILGEHHPIEDHHINELKEQIYSGKGIIASLYLKHGWYHDNECSHDQKHDNLFGIKYKGQLSGDNHQIELLNSQISEPDVLDAKGKASKIEANDINTIAALIEEDNKHNHKKQYQYPAIVLNTYGLGKTIYYAFDLGMTLDETNYTKIAAIIKNSITYIHKPQTQTTFQTNQLIPVEIQVKSLGSAFNLKLTETYPQEIKIYNPLTGNWITSNPWEIETQLPANETKTTLYYALMPNTIGTYTLKTDIGYIENNTYSLYQTLSLDINVSKNNQILTNDIITALKALAVSHHDKHKLRTAIEKIEKVQKRTIRNKHDIEQNIRDILMAIDSLISINSADISSARLMMDHLLMMWESKWFLM